MSVPKHVDLRSISRDEREVLSPVELEHLVPLPPPYDRLEDQPEWKELSDEARERLVCNLDGVVALSLPWPETEEEKQEAVAKFETGLKKLFSRENNWTFLQPLTLSTDYCTACQSCIDACPVYEMSGGNDVYKPTFRAEILRRLVRKYARPGGKTLSKLKGEDIELNWATLTRLYELAYRCTMCRRCAQVCPIGVDNGLITHELRKLFSQELGWAPGELHEKGTLLQLKVGSSTGMNPIVVKDNVEFIDEDIEEETGLDARSPFDVEEADALLIHNAGEIMAWPENPGAFAIILNAAGYS